MIDFFFELVSFTGLGVFRLEELNTLQQISTIFIRYKLKETTVISANFAYGNVSHLNTLVILSLLTGLIMMHITMKCKQYGSTVDCDQVALIYELVEEIFD